MRTLTGSLGLALLLSLALSGQARAEGITVLSGSSAPSPTRALGPAPEPPPPAPASGGSYVAAGTDGCDRNYPAWEGSFHGDGEPGSRSDEVRRGCRSGRHAVIGYEGGRYGDWRYRRQDLDDADRTQAAASEPATAAAPEVASAAEPAEPCGPETGSATVAGTAWTVEGSSCPNRPRIWQLTPADQD